MKTVNEVSKLFGVSVRTLQYYDSIGLLPATYRTPAGYRIYDDVRLARLGNIMMLRQIEFSLEEIKEILDSPGFDAHKALEGQLELLRLKREHIDGLIVLAENMKKRGLGTMEYRRFDDSKIKEYKAKAKRQWKDSPAYREYEEKSMGRDDRTENMLGAGLMDIFRSFGEQLRLDPDPRKAEGLVEKLQGYITEHYYTCTDEILSGLGDMYAAGGEFTANIDRAAGEGTAVFVRDSIDGYLLKKL